jgi:L-ascorbate metabolism protein UlaG (beta-lactamase superfamily)
MMSIDAKRIAFALIMLALAASGLAQTPEPGKKKDIKITWLGHSAFEIVSAGGTDIMIDPFLTKNPATPTELKDLAHYHPGYVLVTHSHGDHLGDAIELRNMSKAKLVCVPHAGGFQQGRAAKGIV